MEPLLDGYCQALIMIGAKPIALTVLASTSLQAHSSRNSRELLYGGAPKSMAMRVTGTPAAPANRRSRGPA